MITYNPEDIGYKAPICPVCQTRPRKLNENPHQTGDFYYKSCCSIECKKVMTGRASKTRWYKMSFEERKKNLPFKKRKKGKYKKFTFFDYDKLPVGSNPIMRRVNNDNIRMGKKR